MTKAIYPGSFDPITIGHMDIIERAASSFDELIIGVLLNCAKRPLFTIDERVEMITEVVSHLPNVRVKSFDGLLVDFAKQEDAKIIVRGIRAVSDFENELMMAQTNKQLNPEIETIFLATSAEHSYLSSSTVKELAAFHGEFEQFVPDTVSECMHLKFN